MNNKSEKKSWDFGENISLAQYTSFNIGGSARYFLLAKSEKEISRAVDFARKNKLKIFILGSGTNLLVSDQGFDGLVIKLDNDFLKFNKEYVETGAATSLQRLIDESIEKNLSGLEMMSGIGGTVGGAVRGNAGAFGQSIGDTVDSVLAIVDTRIKKFSHIESEFNYRESIFKRNEAIIISTKLKLVFDKKKDLRAKADEIIKKRNERYNVNWQCAGCVFKNIDLKQVRVDRERIIKELDIDAKEYDEVTKYQKLPVSFITDRLGLKGKKIGGAMIAHEHGAFIINVGGARAEDVITLMSYIKTLVRDRLGIQLENEIELVGF